MFCFSKLVKILRWWMLFVFLIKLIYYCFGKLQVRNNASAEYIVFICVYSLVTQS